jgi:enamine deaminase RidA (YjgF/YER057c/UK114 family)
MTVEQKLQSMEITLPETPKPVAAYIPALQVNDLIFTSGQIPMVGGEIKYKGKLGAEISKEQGYLAAKMCALNALSAIKGVVGDLERVEQVVKVVGFVASAIGFTDQPAVINGASEFLQEVLGKKGVHARSAVGVAELPLGVPVEVELIVKIKLGK